MKQLFFILLLTHLFITNHLFATDAIEKLKDYFEIVDESRRNVNASNQVTVNKSRAEIDNILNLKNCTLTNKPMNGESKTIVKKTVLTRYLSQTSLDITQWINSLGNSLSAKQSLFGKILLDEKSHYNHFLALTILHLGSQTAARDEAILFKGRQYLIDQVLSSITKTINNNSKILGNGFVNYVNALCNIDDKINSILDLKFFDLIFELTHKYKGQYKDINKPWLTDAYEWLNEHKCINKQMQIVNLDKLNNINTINVQKTDFKIEIISKNQDNSWNNYKVKVDARENYVKTDSLYIRYYVDTNILAINSTHMNNSNWTDTFCLNNGWKLTHSPDKLTLERKKVFINDIKYISAFGSLGNNIEHYSCGSAKSLLIDPITFTLHNQKSYDPNSPNLDKLIYLDYNMSRNELVNILIKSNLYNGT